mmetsp:Transcript_6259/g.13562  ORF Transcript_6259/g.13562 Transcript_6259/m.13562 type:complete len:86 (+) Transcript_6259:356-613(+)
MLVIELRVQVTARIIYKFRICVDGNFQAAAPNAIPSPKRKKNPKKLRTHIRQVRTMATASAIVPDLGPLFVRRRIRRRHPTTAVP